MKDLIILRVFSFFNVYVLFVVRWSRIQQNLPYGKTFVLYTVTNFVLWVGPTFAADIHYTSIKWLNFVHFILVHSCSLSNIWNSGWTMVPIVGTRFRHLACQRNFIPIFKLHILIYSINKTKTDFNTLKIVL